MAAVTITIEDLAPFASIDDAKAQAMIDDALAWAALDAPCILSEDFEHADAAKAIIRGAILRWHDAGSGAFTQEAVGPFSHSFDNRVRRDGMFTDAELDKLRRLCSGETTGAFDIDTVSTSSVHADVCSLNFGALYCSCGADIAGFPLYEVDP